MCNATILTLEIRKLYLQNFEILDKYNFFTWSIMLKQFGYCPYTKEKKYESMFDKLPQEFKDRIQHYECLQYLLKFNPDYEKYKSTIEP
jgi:uncharacterized protein YqgQ